MLLFNNTHGSCSIRQFVYSTSSILDLSSESALVVEAVRICRNGGTSSSEELIDSTGTKAKIQDNVDAIRFKVV